MSLVTACPECSTKFYVTSEQLSAHGGQVRCGQCHHLFNAYDSLGETPSTSVDSVTFPAAVADSADSAETTDSVIKDAVVSPAIEGVDIEAQPEEILQTEPAADPQEHPDTPDAVAETGEDLIEIRKTEENNLAAPDVTLTFESEEIPYPPSANQPESAAILIEPAAMRPPEPIPQPGAPTTQDNRTLKPPVQSPRFTIMDDMEFINRLDKKKRISAPSWLLILLALLLTLLVIGQSAYYLRTPIATRWPAVKPLLVKSCTLLGCKVELPQQADLLVIDDSDLEQDNEYQGLINLTATVINNAPFTQAYPLLELTLTDAFDKPKLRRIFQPGQYMAAGTNIENGVPPGEELHIKLTLTAGDAPVSGYRVSVIYP